MIRGFLALIILGVLCGCSAPEGTYRITDSVTGLGVAGADVTLYRDPMHPGPYPSVPEPFEELETLRTHDDGSVVLARWREGHVIAVAADGYESARFELYPLLLEPRLSGNLSLEPKE